MARVQKIFPGDGDPRHGTANGYSNLGCRCAPCTHAHSAYCYEQKQKPRTPLPPDDPRHGTSSGYRWWHCHCRKCLDKLAEDSRTWQKRQKEKRSSAAS